jgi:hypothetical protein
VSGGGGAFEGGVVFVLPVREAVILIPDPKDVVISDDIVDGRKVNVTWFPVNVTGVVMSVGTV